MEFNIFDKDFPERVDSDFDDDSDEAFTPGDYACKMWDEFGE